MHLKLISFKSNQKQRKDDMLFKSSTLPHHKSIFIFGVPKQIFKKLREVQYVVVLNLCTKVEDRLYTNVQRPADEDIFLRICDILGSLLHILEEAGQI
jgi:hypothetical protein